MKKMFLFLGVIFMTTFFFCSCQPTSKENESPYKLNIYGNSYNLTQAILWEGNPYETFAKMEYVWQDRYQGEDGVEIVDKVVGFEKGADVNSGNFRLNLFDDGITFMSSTNSFAGVGTVVSIHFASESLTELKPGKYTCNSSKSAGTFMGYLATSYEFNGKNQQIISITKGDIVVEKTATGLKFSISAETAAGIAFTANYDGKVNPLKLNQSKNITDLANVTLGSLIPERLFMYYEGGVRVEGGDMLDLDEYSPALFNILSVSVSTPNDVSYEDTRQSIHMTSFFDEANNEIVMTSPIKIRSILGHDDDAYLCPCHTRYKMATDMTIEKFNNFDGRVDITFTDNDKVAFSTTNFVPGFFYFETGDGISGLVYVKATLDPIEVFIEGDASFGLKNIFNNQLLLDVKTITNYSDPKI